VLERFLNSHFWKALGHISVLAWILSLAISVTTAVIQHIHGKPLGVVAFWFFAVLAGCFAAINQRYRIYNWTRKQFPKEQPNIIVHSFEVRNASFLGMPARAQFHALHLFLKNDSENSTEQCKAREVTATIDFYSLRNGIVTLICRLDHGRWADGKYVSQEHPKSEIALADFPPGHVRDLDIAMKLAADRDCYAVNNDNFASPDLRIESHRLKGTHFVAEVRIRGIGVNKTWKLRFRNEGKSAAFTGLSYFQIDQK
jgi:hypothetical protein